VELGILSVTVPLWQDWDGHSAIIFGMSAIVETAPTFLFYVVVVVVVVVVIIFIVHMQPKAMIDIFTRGPIYYT
jgi:hypothetical protein